LVSDIKGRTYTEGISEEGVEENVWTEEDRNNRKSVKITQ
jgi:hypothetical protein